MDLRKSENLSAGTPKFSQLLPGLNETTIVVRVTRAWKSVSGYDSTEMIANFILLDEEDNQVHAVAKGKDINCIWPKLCEDLLYYITNFRLVASPIKWKPVQSNWLVLLSRETRIDYCCKPVNISDLKFELKMLSALEQHHPNMDALIDVCGVLLKVVDMGTTINDIDKLQITIMDHSCVSVPVILWGRQATLFGIHFNLHRKINTVLILPGLRIKEISGKAYLSSTPATHIHYNPVYEPLQNLQIVVGANYGNVMCRKPPPTTHDYMNNQAQIVDLKSIYELCNHRIQQKVTLNHATIIDLLSTTNWSSDSCICCSHNVNLYNGTYYCERCKKHYNPYINRSMQATLIDATGSTGEFIIQPREIAQLIGISPLQLVCTSTNQLPHIAKGTPTKKMIDSIKGNKCSVEVEYYQEPTAKYNGKYIIKTIVESSKLKQEKKTVTLKWDLPYEDMTTTALKSYLHEPKRKENRQKSCATVPLSDAPSDVSPVVFRQEFRRVLSHEELKELFQVDAFNGLSVTKLLKSQFV